MLMMFSALGSAWADARAGGAASDCREAVIDGGALSGGSVISVEWKLINFGFGIGLSTLDVDSRGRFLVRVSYSFSAACFI